MPITRTDLAMESFENADGGAIPGAQVSRWESGGIEITEVLITDNEAAQLLDKPKGTYLTLESPLLMERDPDARLAMASLLAEEIDRMLPDGDGSAPVLVVGLGNRSITPDALGPGVVDRTLVTRHMLGAPWAQSGMKMKGLNFLAAFIGGAAIGAAFGILFAPEKGVDTRQKIKDILREKGIKLNRSEMDELVDKIAAEVKDTVD